MRVIYLLLIVCLSLVSAKYLPNESASALLNRRLRSVDDDDSSSSSSESSEVKTVEERLKELEENREKILEEEQRRQLEKREEENRKHEEKIEREVRKHQEKLEKEERKRQERIEKENHKREEAERKEQEKLEKQERKREEKLRKQLKKLEKEALEKNTLPDSPESTEVDVDDESVDLEDIWKGYVYEKYNLSAASTRLEKLSALNKYFEEELHLTANSTKSERRQAIIKLIQDNLSNDTASSSLSGYMRSHVNAAAIQKISSKLEKKIANLNNDSSVLENVTWPWVPAAKANIDEKRFLMQSILQFVNNLLPSWVTGGTNSSGNVPSVTGVPAGISSNTSPSNGNSSPVVGSPTDASNTGATASADATTANSNINSENESSTGPAATSTTVAVDGSGQDSNTISIGSQPTLGNSNSIGGSGSAIEGSSNGPVVVSPLNTDATSTATDTVITVSGSSGSENPASSSVIASGVGDQSTGSVDANLPAPVNNSPVISQEPQEVSNSIGSGSIGPISQLSTGSPVESVSENVAPVDSTVGSNNVVSSVAQDSGINNGGLVSVSSIPEEGGLITGTTADSSTGSSVSSASLATVGSDSTVSSGVQDSGSSSVLPGDEQQNSVPSIDVVSGNVAPVGDSTNTGSVNDVVEGSGSLDSALSTSDATQSGSPNGTSGSTVSTAPSSQGSNTDPNLPTIDSSVTVVPETVDVVPAGDATNTVVEAAGSLGSLDSTVAPSVISESSLPSDVTSMMSSSDSVPATGSTDSPSSQGSNTNILTADSVSAAPGTADVVVLPSISPDGSEPTKDVTNTSDGPASSPNGDGTAVTESFNVASSGLQESNTNSNVVIGSADTASTGAVLSGQETTNEASGVSIISSVSVTETASPQIGSVDVVASNVASGTEEISVSPTNSEVTNSQGAVTTTVDASSSDSSSSLTSVTQVEQTTEVISITQAPQDLLTDANVIPPSEPETIIASNVPAITPSEEISEVPSNTNTEVNSTSVPSNNTDTPTVASTNTIPEVTTEITLIGKPADVTQGMVELTTAATNSGNDIVTTIAPAQLENVATDTVNNAVTTMLPGIIVTDALPGAGTTIPEVIATNDPTTAAVEVSTVTVENNAAVQSKVDQSITEVPVVQPAEEVTASQIATETSKPESNVPEVYTPVNALDMGEPGATVIDVQLQ